MSELARQRSVAGSAASDKRGNLENSDAVIASTRGRSTPGGLEVVAAKLLGPRGLGFRHACQATRYNATRVQPPGH